MTSLNTMAHEIFPMFQTGVSESDAPVGHEEHHIDPSAPITELDVESFPPEPASTEPDKNDLFEDSPSMADEEPETYPESINPSARRR